MYTDSIHQIENGEDITLVDNKNKKVFYINNLTLLTHIRFIQKRIYLKISHIQYNEHIAPYNSLSLMHH